MLDPRTEPLMCTMAPTLLRLSARSSFFSQMSSTPSHTAPYNDSFPLHIENKFASVMSSLNAPTSSSMLYTVLSSKRHRPVVVSALFGAWGSSSAHIVANTVYAADSMLFGSAVHAFNRPWRPLRSPCHPACVAASGLTLTLSRRTKCESSLRPRVSVVSPGPALITSTKHVGLPVCWCCGRDVESAPNSWSAGVCTGSSVCGSSAQCWRRILESPVSLSRWTRTTSHEGDGWMRSGSEVTCHVSPLNRVGNVLRVFSRQHTTRRRKSTLLPVPTAQMGVRASSTPLVSSIGVRGCSSVIGRPRLLVTLLAGPASGPMPPLDSVPGVMVHKRCSSLSPSAVRFTSNS